MLYLYLIFRHMYIVFDCSRNIKNTNKYIQNLSQHGLLVSSLKITCYTDQVDYTIFVNLKTSYTHSTIKIFPGFVQSQINTTVTNNGLLGR